MENKEDLFDLIDKYLNGSLSPEEQKKYDFLMETDDSFRSEFKLHEEIRNALVERKVQDFSESL